MYKILFLLLVLLGLAGCGVLATAGRLNGTWQTEGATITLDTNAGTYQANIAGQDIQRSLKVTSMTERSVTMQLDNGRELVATFPPGTWDTVTMGIKENWEFTFQRAQ